MKSINSPRLFVLLASMWIALFTTHARASEGLKTTIVPYLWIPFVDSNFTVEGIEENDDRVELGERSTFFDDLGLSGVPVLVKGFVEYDKLAVVFDFQYVRIGQDGTVALDPSRDYDADLTVVTSTLALGYELVGTNEVKFDIFAGVRGMYAAVNAEVHATGSESELEGDADKYFLDPIVGMHARWRFADSWSLYGYADIGGFDVSTKLTGQALGAIGYHFNENLSLHVGYQFFTVDFEEGPFELDLGVHGPVVGLAISF